MLPATILQRLRWSSSARIAGSVLLCATLLPGPAPAQSSLRPGDLMFTNFNAMQDGWAVVALVDIAPSTTVYFSNDALTAKGFAPGGGIERWVTGAEKIKTGTVVRFVDIDDPNRMSASLGSLTREIVPGSSYLNVSQVAGTLYAYQGLSADSPSIFLTAVSNGGFAADVGALAGTGLSAGVNALSLSPGARYAEFNANLRNSFSTADGLRTLLSNPALFQIETVGDFAAVAAEGTPLTVLTVPEPGGIPMLILAAAIVAIAGRTPPISRGVKAVTGPIGSRQRAGPAHR